MTFPCIKCKIHKYTITQIRKYTNKKCLKDPTCAIFFKSMGFKDIKYDIPVWGGPRARRANFPRVSDKASPPFNAYDTLVTGMLRTDARTGISGT